MDTREVLFWLLPQGHQSHHHRRGGLQLLFLYDSSWDSAEDIYSIHCVWKTVPNTSSAEVAGGKWITLICRWVTCVRHCLINRNVWFVFVSLLYPLGSTRLCVYLVQSIGSLLNPASIDFIQGNAQFSARCLDRQIHIKDNGRWWRWKYSSGVPEIDRSGFVWGISANLYRWWLFSIFRGYLLI